MRPLERLVRALAVLGEREPDVPETPAPDPGVLRERLALCNALLGTIEREVVETESVADTTPVPGDLIKAAATRSAAAAEWTPEELLAVHQWRAARMQQALQASFPDDAADPVGAAACAAAALTAMLLTYREAVEMWEHELPTALLADMMTLSCRLSSTLKSLAR